MEYEYEKDQNTKRVQPVSRKPGISRNFPGFDRSLYDGHVPFSKKDWDLVAKPVPKGTKFDDIFKKYYP